ncbi:histidinol-phosphate transaminase [Chryseolinea sp. H1M3-3]|uniref:histidinol-phosphate transaminase n=1 Tax=Chryseolinea sp. H1M3-3 TaxID=3034144 RepID=UPI0023ED81CB|nr:histidinol-phosphate transaminase [Chryseolinea sp. H1M3-3]
MTVKKAPIMRNKLRVEDVLKLVRKNIVQMKPYSSARDEFKGEAEIFLDANENPYPTGYNRYPDPLQWRIKEKLSLLKHVQPEQIFLGNGSDEGIDLVIRAFCEPYKDSIIITDPTYGMYAVCAALNAAPLIKVPLTSNFDLDVESLLDAVTNETKVIFLCSPNNPTGNLLSREKILRVLDQFPGIVVIDEAYIDFTSSASFTELINSYPNLIVLQTFSKAWGLAGLRLGMAFGAKEIIGVLNKIKYPYNVNIQTQEIVLKALDNVNVKENAVREIIEQRKQLAQELLTLSITEEVYPSDSNFLLVRVKDAPATYQYLMERKIIVRDRSKVTLCKNCIRITVGTPQENRNLITALKNL